MNASQFQFKVYFLGHIHLYSTAIDTYVSSDPSAFGVKRAWNLDPRGNRTGSSGVRDTDDGNGGSPTTIYDTSVTVSSDKMNLYTDVGGAAFEFDAIEQMTRDRSTETYHRYDWRGQLWKSDDDSDFSTPERFYTYDCQGRRKVEEKWYEASTHLFSIDVCVTACASECIACSGDPIGDLPSAIYNYNSSGSLIGLTEYFTGLGMHGLGSSSATHPATVMPASARPAGNVIIAERLDNLSAPQVWWHHEGMLNETVGLTDENGWRVFQNSYLAFGECLQSRVLYDGAISRLSEIFFDEIAGVTTISLANEDLSTDQLNGALLFLARPGYNGDRHMEAVVVDTTASSIVIADASGALAEALGSDGRPIADFVVFAFNDSKQANAPTYQTQGTWTSAPSYASSQTTFTDADADDNGGGFASWMVGALLVPDVNIGAPLLIIGATATTLTVAGDARGVAGNGSQYIVYVAPFTDPAHGTFQTDMFKAGSQYLWAGYRYMAPRMGFWVDPPGAPSLSVYGAQTGNSKLGQYYAWNRTYDVNIGRWTTPDALATPWTSLTRYEAGVLKNVDPNGLGGIDLPDPEEEEVGKQITADKVETTVVQKFKNEFTDWGEESREKCCWNGNAYVEKKRFKWVNKTDITRTSKGVFNLVATVKEVKLEGDNWVIAGGAIAIAGGAGTIVVGAFSLPAGVGVIEIGVGVLAVAGGAVAIVRELFFKYRKAWIMEWTQISGTTKWSWENQWDKYINYSFSASTDKVDRDVCPLRRNCPYRECKQPKWDPNSGPKEWDEHVGKSAVDSRSSDKASDVPGYCRGGWESSWEK